MSTTRILPITAALLALAIPASACSTPEETTAAKAKQTSPAAARVFKRIENTKSCAKLQGQFDQAMTNAETRQPGDSLRDLSMSYADAAIKRMERLGC